MTLAGFACQRYGEAGIADPVLWCPHTRDRTRSGRYYPHHWPRETGAAIMALLPVAAGRCHDRERARGARRAGRLTVDVSRLRER